MPRKKRRRKITTIFSRGKASGGIEQTEVSERDVPFFRDSAKKIARQHGTNLKIIESPNKSTVSFSGVTQEQWDAIFKKKKKGKGKK